MSWEQLAVVLGGVDEKARRYFGLGTVVGVIVFESVLRRAMAGRAMAAPTAGAKRMEDPPWEPYPSKVMPFASEETAAISGQQYFSNCDSAAGKMVCPSGLSPALSAFAPRVPAISWRG